MSACQGVDVTEANAASLAPSASAHCSCAIQKTCSRSSAMRNDDELPVSALDTWQCQVAAQIVFLDDIAPLK